VGVVGVESCSDLVDVTVDESLGPCHDGHGLRALLGSKRRRHGLWGERVEERTLHKYGQSFPVFSVEFEESCHGGLGGAFS